MLGSRSWACSILLVQQPADLVDFPGGGGLGGEGVQQQPQGRATEGPAHQIGHHPPLGRCLRHRGRVDVRAQRCVAPHQTLFRHDLKQLEHRGVADRLGALEGLTHGANRARRSEEHTSELQSQSNLVCRLLLEKKKCDITYYLGSHTKPHRTEPNRAYTISKPCHIYQSLRHSITQSAAMLQMCYTLTLITSPST